MVDGEFPQADSDLRYYRDRCANLERERDDARRQASELRIELAESEAQVEHLEAELGKAQEIGRSAILRESFKAGTITDLRAELEKVSTALETAIARASQGSNAAASAAQTTVTALERLELMDPVVKAAIHMYEDGEAKPCLRAVETYLEAIKDRV